MKGMLVLTDTIESLDEEFEVRFSSYDFALGIYVGEKSLKEQLKNKEGFQRCMDKIKESNKDFRETFDEDTSASDEMVDTLESVFDGIFKKVEYIKFDFQTMDVWKFIKENPIVLTKKLVFNEQVDITEFDKINELNEKYAPLKGEAYITLEGNQSYVSIDECLRTVEDIQYRADQIKKLGLSPFETVMYVYDQVRNRVYTLEGENESMFKSRDLSEVLFGDKIVCAGYARIFSALLYSLGYNNSYITYDDATGNHVGHARNEVYIKDDKYGIDGIYYFDPTFDSKRRDGTNSYLRSYRYFALTRREMNGLTDSLVESYLKEFDDDLYNKIVKAFEEKNTLLLMKYGIVANRVLRYTGKENMFSEKSIIYCAGNTDVYDVDLMLKELKDSIDRFNKKIPAEKFIKALDTVREVENKQDSNWYPYGLDELYTVFVNSNWMFEDVHFDKSTEKLLRIFGEEYTPMLSAQDNYLNFIKNEGLIDKQLKKEVRASKLKKEDKK